MATRILSLATIFVLAAPQIFSQREDREELRQTRPEPNPEIEIREWESGALKASEELGCKRAMWQQRGEKLRDAIALYSRGYLPGDCLILQPLHGTTANGSQYFLSYAGQFEGRITNDIPAHWPGTPVFYVSDNPLAVLVKSLIPEKTYQELQQQKLEPTRDIGCDRLFANHGDWMQFGFAQLPGSIRENESDCLVIDLDSARDASKYDLPKVNRMKKNPPENYDRYRPAENVLVFSQTPLEKAWACMGYRFCISETDTVRRGDE